MIRSGSMRWSFTAVSWGSEPATATWSISGPSAYGTMAITTGGVWTYTLNNGLTATQELAEGESVTETFTATVTDDTLNTPPSSSAHASTAGRCGSRRRAVGRSCAVKI